MYKPPFEINENVLNTVIEISNKLGRLSTSTNKKMTIYLRKASLIRTVNSSCAIEGNMLTEKQAEMIINGTYFVTDADEPCKEICLA